jgi:hypothetical protein
VLAPAATTRETAAAISVLVAALVLFAAIVLVLVLPLGGLVDWLLLDEGSVIVPPARIGDRRTAIGRHADVGQVADGPAIDANRANGVADADGAASIAAAVDVANGDRAAVGGRVRDATVAGARDAVSDLIPKVLGPCPLRKQPSDSRG